MKVAVSALGSTLDAMVDQRFGRAQCFIIADTASDALEALAAGELRELTEAGEAHAG